jgi:hypothetical protein
VDELFEPGGGWSGVSPVLATVRRVVLAAVVLVVAALVGLALVLADRPLGAVAVAALAGAVLAWGWWFAERNRRSWGYTEREQDLLVRRGVLWRSLVVVPYGRMQFVDVTRGPLERAFGIATVQLHTAAAATDARIPGLPPDEAARLRDRLAHLGETRTAGL